MCDAAGVNDRDQSTSEDETGQRRRVAASRRAEIRIGARDVTPFHLFAGGFALSLETSC